MFHMLKQTKKSVENRCYPVRRLEASFRINPQDLRDVLYKESKFQQVEDRALACFCLSL